jgi:hypothetical protein
MKEFRMGLTTVYITKALVLLWEDSVTVNTKSYSTQQTDHTEVRLTG